MTEEHLKSLKECREMLFKYHTRHINLLSSKWVKVGFVITLTCTVGFLGMIFYAITK